jgi:hypothetical protein
MSDESQDKYDLYTLIPIEEFKTLMGVDDRDDKTARFCLVTATLTIEEYCKRKFLQKQYFETFSLKEKLLVILKEYPISEIIAVYQIDNDSLIEPQFYRPMIGNDYNEEMPFELLLSSSLKPYQISAIRVNYLGGYTVGSVPANLSAACLELASWNFNRYKGKRIGMSGNIRGAGVQGEHFEMSIPENVKALIEPYRRKTI